MKKMIIRYQKVESTACHRFMQTPLQTLINKENAKFESNKIK